MTRETVELTPLGHDEMLTLVGGLTGDGGEAFIRDAFYFVGAVVGVCWNALTHPPESSYSYAKVGY